MSMVQSEVIAEIADGIDIPKNTVKLVIQSLLELITDELSKDVDNSIQFSGFGTFAVRHVKARKGRNPATGKAIMIEEKFQPKFVAGATLKKAVQKALAC
jgi:DNA-binding protein HU-beta